MKILRNILFRLLFMVAVLFGLESEVYSDTHVQACKVEVSSEMSSVDDILSSDFDSFDDDHINQIQEACLVAEPVLWMTTPKYIFLLHRFPHSNWQPPKYS